MLSIFLHHSHSTVKREWRDWIRHSSAATRPGCHRHFLRWPERRALAPAAANTVSSTSSPESGGEELPRFALAAADCLLQQAELPSLVLAAADARGIVDVFSGGRSSRARYLLRWTRNAGACNVVFCLQAKDCCSMVDGVVSVLLVPMGEAAKTSLQRSQRRRVEGVGGGTGSGTRIEVGGEADLRRVGGGVGEQREEGAAASQACGWRETAPVAPSRGWRWRRRWRAEGGSVPLPECASAAARSSGADDGTRREWVATPTPGCGWRAVAMAPMCRGLVATLASGGRRGRRRHWGAEGGVSGSGAWCQWWHSVSRSNGGGAEGRAG